MDCEPAIRNDYLEHQTGERERDNDSKINDYEDGITKGREEINRHGDCRSPNM